MPQSYLIAEQSSRGTAAGRCQRRSAAWRQRLADATPLRARMLNREDLQAVAWVPESKRRSTERTCRLWHTFPKLTDFAAWVVDQLRRRPERHGGTRLRIVGLPGRNARIVRVTSTGKCNPCRRELLCNAQCVIAIASFAEGRGHIQPMHGAVAATPRRRRPVPLIHIDRALPLGGFQLRLLERRATKARVGEDLRLNQIR